MSVRGKLGVALGLALLAYVPFLALPLISDDYVQIYLARQFAPVDGWKSLFDDVLYRSRATSLLLTYAVDWLAGLDPTAHRLLNLLLHMMNVALVVLLGSWPKIGWRISLPAGFFFAIHEGHQEAVVWSAALPELLVFLFGVGSLLLWMHGRPAAASSAFLLALLSKESAVAILPLMVWFWWWEQGKARSGVPWLAGMGVVSLVYAVGIFGAGGDHLHLNDGTFSITAAFWQTLPVSTFRLLWIWGLAALALLAAFRTEARMVAMSLGWIAVTLMPYCFLTYMNRVPSRHVYLASAGLALLVGAAFALVQERWGGRRRWLPVALALAVVAHNLGYLWVKKLDQYERRGAITERFLREAARHDLPISVSCGAYGIDVYRYAATLRLGSPLERVQQAGSPDAATGSAAYCDPDQP